MDGEILGAFMLTWIQLFYLVYRVGRVEEDIKYLRDEVVYIKRKRR